MVRSFFSDRVTEILPVAHQIIDSVTASTSDFEHYMTLQGVGTSGHLVAGDQLPGEDSPPCVMMACDKLLCYFDPSDYET